MFYSIQTIFEFFLHYEGVIVGIYIINAIQSNMFVLYIKS